MEAISCNNSQPALFNCLKLFHFLFSSCYKNFQTYVSIQVVSAYENDGFEFLKKVFNVPKYLEDMSGLTELHSSIVEAEVSFLVQ